MCMKQAIQVLTLLFFFSAISLFVAYRSGYFDKDTQVISFDHNGSVLNSNSTIQNNQQVPLPLDSIPPEFERIQEFEPAPRMISSSKSMIISDRIEFKLNSWEIYRSKFSAERLAALDSLDAAITRVEQRQHEIMMMSSKSGFVLGRKDMLERLSPDEFAKWDSTQLRRHITIYEKQSPEDRKTIFPRFDYSHKYDSTELRHLDSVWIVLYEYRSEKRKVENAH